MEPVSAGRPGAVAVGVAMGVIALAGLLTGVTMPRGPITFVQALIGMGVCLGIGLVAGLALRSRWALLPAALVYFAAFELARLGAVGPTVDAIRLNNTAGILAFVLGRGFFGFVVLPAMILGVNVGAAMAQHVSMARPSTILPAIVVAAMAALVSWPAGTPPIVDKEGEPLPGSVAELVTVPIGGHDQALLIRGYSTDKPVLLYLSGGPGQSNLPFTRVLFDDLSRDFIIVTWDQRGTGKSYSALDPVSTLTLEQAIADTNELAAYLCERFDEEKIYLLGESWGSTLGVLAAQQRPDLYHAVIGSGQMVSQVETDRRLYYDVLDYAARTGDAALSRQMRAYGEPPYADMSAYMVVMGYYERLYKPYTPPAAYIERGTAARLGPWGVLASEYNLVEKVNSLRGFLDMGSTMYPQLQDIDFRRDVPRLDVPLYILDGEAELSARRDLALEWFEMVDAPIKRIYSFENAAHAPAFEHFEAFGEIMTGTILPETYHRR
ncbi:MAG TPA: alpha/beta fold hydrolase [Chloroflexi bacterium]|jgi:proline iminopeptidase|nr:alpha/beta fold hydrolase [Chloroflexota bacterium]